MRGIRGIFTCAVLGLAFMVAGSRPPLSAGSKLVQPRNDEFTLSQRPGPTSAQEFPAPFEPLPKTITPCRACHGKDKDFPVNYKRREALLVHTAMKLNHGGVRVWCLDCHHPDQRDYLLPLSDGKLIPFDQSYLLCGKCHGTKYRDWRDGIHGLRTGAWNGEKTYQLCVHCHNPHTPRFKRINPLPPPQKPWTPKEKVAGK
jgi:hypothetical protein